MTLRGSHLKVDWVQDESGVGIDKNGNGTGEKTLNPEP